MTNSHLLAIRYYNFSRFLQAENYNTSTKASSKIRDLKAKKRIRNGRKLGFRVSGNLLLRRSWKVAKIGSLSWLPKASSPTKITTSFLTELCRFLHLGKNSRWRSWKIYCWMSICKNYNKKDRAKSRPSRGRSSWRKWRARASILKMMSRVTNLRNFWEKLCSHSSSLKIYKKRKNILWILFRKMKTIVQIICSIAVMILRMMRRKTLRASYLNTIFKKRSSNYQWHHRLLISHFIKDCIHREVNRASVSKSPISTAFAHMCHLTQIQDRRLRNSNILRNLSRNFWSRLELTRIS